jgi:phage shock protein PspC (stress-responsive transcriptional regulator)
MDPRVRDLVLTGLLAGVCAGLAWNYNHELFALVFAVAAILAGFHAARQQW